MSDFLFDFRLRRFGQIVFFRAMPHLSPFFRLLLLLFIFVIVFSSHRALWLATTPP